MTKAELIDHMVGKHGLSKAEAGRLVGGVFDFIKDSIVDSGEFAYAGFGKFRVTATKARQGRNPHTGEALQIAAGKRIGFKASTKLKGSI